MLDKCRISCYHNVRKIKEDTEMKYEINAFRYHATVESLDLARAIFDEVKRNFTYCELKEIFNLNGNYYAKSIEIYYK